MRRPSYRAIPYPNGDVLRSTGVCSDVVVRAARDAWRADLQQLIHEDMTRNFDAYPSRRAWGLKGPDSNIDHRRVLNLEADDTTIELGEGALPIHGRDTLVGMAARLQPRTAAFRLEIDDVSVEMVPGAEAADVLLTASFVRRSLSTGEESRDAREFSLVCRKNAGTWQIARVTAIDTLR